MLEYRIFNSEQHDLNTVINHVIALCQSLDYDAHTIDNNIRSLVQSNVLRIFVAIDNSEIVGIIGFYVTLEIFNTSLINATEAFWYMMPQYRTGYGRELLNFAIDTLKNTAHSIELGIANKRLLSNLLQNGFEQQKTIIKFKG